jgi:undecaprenyl-diphosphatase
MVGLPSFETLSRTVAAAREALGGAFPATRAALAGAVDRVATTSRPIPSIPESVELTREFFVSLGVPGLFAVAFLEFFLLPVPPDLVLIPLTVARPELALVYAAVATAGSVSAGLLGYGVGYAGGRPALESRFDDERVRRAESYVDRHGFATVAFGAFAPIPEGFELLSVAAGVFGLDARSYVLAALLGRGGKYALAALLVVAIGRAARSLSAVELYAVLAAAAAAALVAYLARADWVPERWRAAVR